ncbi:MAG: deoxyuridine 5'-triphosphate nucleotidohydrolase [Chloroflexota bacterium]
MDYIDLRGLTAYGYHGVLPEEQRLGQRFVVDVQLGLDLQAAGQRDDLLQTVNYAEVAEAVQSLVQGPPRQLIESLAESICAALLRRFPSVAQVRVRVGKPSAPISAVPSVQVAVEITRQRTMHCRAVPPEASAHLPQGAVLSADSIRALLAADPPLVSPIRDPELQIQPNGVDVTLESVWRLEGAGQIGRTNQERQLPERTPIEPSADGWFDLAPGTYMIRLEEVVSLPLDIMAFGRPRSSLLRAGAALHTAVWDAGYRGRSESLLVVYATAGVRLSRGARVLQLVFVRLDTATEAYAGSYQGENLQV